MRLIADVNFNWIRPSAVCRWIAGQSDRGWDGKEGKGDFTDRSPLTGQSSTRPSVCFSLSLSLLDQGSALSSVMAAEE